MDSLLYSFIYRIFFYYDNISFLFKVQRYFLFTLLFQFHSYLKMIDNFIRLPLLIYNTAIKIFLLLLLNYLLLLIKIQYHYNLWLDVFVLSVLLELLGTINWL